jgi:transposase
MARTKAMQFEDKLERLEEARAAMKATDDIRLFIRYQCIYLYLSGETRIRIAEILVLKLETVGIYIRAYCSEGLEGLRMDHSPGRPRRLTSEQEQELCQVIVNQRPAEVGFPAHMNWDSGMIRQWIERQYQINYSERGTRELLYRLGFSFTRPTYTLAKADPERQEAFKQEFEGLKKITSSRNCSDSV